MAAVGTASLGDAQHDGTPMLAQSIEDADGVAQVFPEHRFPVVDVPQKHGHIVGMTGDSPQVAGLTTAATAEAMLRRGAGLASRHQPRGVRETVRSR